MSTCKNYFFIFLIAISLILSMLACSLTAQEDNGSQEPAPTQIVEPTEIQEPVEPTEEPTKEPTEEPILVEETPEEVSTEDLPEVILDYYTDTPISYTPISDFDESWAQIGWYQYWSIDVPVTNFVIRTDATWSSASDTANWDQSGCGFVFHVQDEKNHFVTYLGLDGYVYVQRMYNGESKSVGSGYYGKMAIPEGNAELMLMVIGEEFYFFVDGTEVVSGSDSMLTSKLNSSELALTLVSGTNKDYGTRCQMINTGLWDLGE